MAKIKTKTKATPFTCYERGASVHHAGLNISCAERLLNAGDPMNAERSLGAARFLLEELTGIVPKKDIPKIRSLQEGIQKARTVIKAKKIGKKDKLIAVAGLIKPWKGLEHSLSKSCSA